MRRATPLVVLVLLAAISGCGGYGSESSTTEGAQPKAGTSTAPAGAAARSCPAAGARAEALKATGAGCAEARRVMGAWLRNRSCVPPAGASRSGCPVGSYRCLATATDRGWSVSCAQPGSSVAFRVRRS